MSDGINDSGVVSAVVEPIAKTDPSFRDQSIALLKQQYAEIASVAKVFNTDDGKVLLDVWKQDIVDESCFTPEHALKHGKDYADVYGYAISGRHNFIRYILNCCQIVEKYKTADEYASKFNTNIGD